MTCLLCNRPIFPPERIVHPRWCDDEPCHFDCVVAYLKARQS